MSEVFDGKYIGTDGQLINALQHMANKRPITKAERFIVAEAAHRIGNLSVLQEQNKALRSQLISALLVIEDYANYEHDGDPWSEDARLMGEMDIDAYMTDGRFQAARAIITATNQEGGE